MIEKMEEKLSNKSVEGQEYGIETISSGGLILAHVFRSNLRTYGARFLTPVDYTLQVGLIEHPKGHEIPTHGHNPKIKYEVDTTQEGLVVFKGKIRANIFTENNKLVDSVILEPGDVYLHVSGMHGFEIEEDSRFWEFKQGPYPGDAIAKVYPKDEK